MTIEQAPASTDDPSAMLPVDAPEALRKAEKALRAAVDELRHMTGQIMLWKALGTDAELHERLGRHSYVGAAAYRLYVALQNAIVLGIARMFDEDSRTPGLNLTILMKAITEPANAKWLREHLQTHFHNMHVHDAGGHSLDDQARSEMMRQIREWSAQQAGEQFDKNLADFVQARRAFYSGEANKALKRLREMRHKELAHNDLEAVWRTARPRIGDLGLVFDEVRKLVFSANVICTGVNHLDLWDLTEPEAMARCFTAVLRPETLDEHHAADEAARANAPVPDSFNWTQRATASSRSDDST